MFKFIPDREQEIALLKYAKLEATLLKHNIEEAEKLEPILKGDGTIHKTKTKERTVIINGWKKEIKKLRKFFNSHKKKGNKNDYKRYNYRKGVSNTRTWIEDTTSSGD